MSTMFQLVSKIKQVAIWDAQARREDDDFNAESFRHVELTDEGLIFAVFEPKWWDRIEKREISVFTLDLPEQEVKKLAWKDILSDLKVNAQETAFGRGHRFGEWEERDTSAYVNCVNCDMQIAVNAKPMPNDIMIGGEALAIFCTVAVDK